MCDITTLNHETGNAMMKCGTLVVEWFTTWSFTFLPWIHQINTLPRAKLGFIVLLSLNPPLVLLPSAICTRNSIDQLVSSTMVTIVAATP
jgi:hypothetical protein